MSFHLQKKLTKFIIKYFNQIKCWQVATCMKPLKEFVLITISYFVHNIDKILDIFHV